MSNGWVGYWTTNPDGPSSLLCEQFIPVRSGELNYILRRDHLNEFSSFFRDDHSIRETVTYTKIVKLSYGLVIV